jgi:hypothetical protein
VVDARTFVDELPTGDIRLGSRSFVRIYGFADIEPRLVEMRVFRLGADATLRLLPEQAEEIAAALIAGAKEARGAT